MSVCVACRQAGIDRLATDYPNEIPMCHQHAIGFPGSALKVIPLDERELRIQKREEQPMIEEKCDCGKPKGHRGRCLGAKKRVEIATEAKRWLPNNKPGRFDDVLQELHKRKMNIEAAIAAILELDK